MTEYKPIKNLIGQIKEKGLKEGIKSSLEKDVVETLRRHPKMIPYLLGTAMLLNEPKPEEEVYVNHLEIDDGEHQLWRTGLVRKSLAEANGWNYCRPR